MARKMDGKQWKNKTMARIRTWNSTALKEGPGTLWKRGAANYGM
jgi:hypothetical protein